MPTPCIQAKNISRSFDGKLAVNSLDLTVYKGEIYGFLGPNGAGKSTTLKMLVTLLSPTSGTILINDLDISKHSEKVRLGLGVALQEASLDESQTGIEFLTLQGRLYGLSFADIKTRIEELMPLIDIGDSFYKQIKTYSGGMKRRLDLAASIIHKPSILFLDEPTTGLDPISRAKVWKEVKKLNEQEGMTILLTSQYLEEADQLADRIGIINDGKLVIEGTPSELKKSIGDDMVLVEVATITEKEIEKIKQIPGVKKVFLADKLLSIVTSSGAELIGKVALELDRLNITVNTLILRTTTLDDVFLEVTGNRLVNQNEEAK